MQWTPDTSAGDWLRERLDDPWTETMHSVVPHGYEAYARILHPATVRSLPGRPVPSPEEYERMPHDEVVALIDQYVDEPATWADARSLTWI